MILHFILFVLTVPTCIYSQFFSDFPVRYRLPENIVPVSYRLYLTVPDVEDNTFSGEIRIIIRVLNSTDRITLHSRNLLIDEVHLNAQEISYSLQPDYDLLDLYLPYEIRPQMYVLGITFSGYFDGEPFGFYRSIAEGVNDTERQLHYTKFEPTYARQAFPCFDEPHLKAPFQITFNRARNNLTILSNTDVSEDSKPIVRFKETVPMSTYLVAYVITDYTFDSKIFKDEKKEIPIRVFTDDSVKSKRLFALDVAVELMNYFSLYTGIGYPMDKIDFITVPNKDFRSGAMENWGLVTFKESRLLYDHQKDGYLQQRSVALVVAHELSHFWFGNLVTMKWWNDIWLNEGFAKYMEYKAVDAVFKNWNLLEHFQVLRLHRLLNYDYSMVSQSVVSDALTPDEIRSQFSIIKYSKGGAILRMLEQWIGEKKFRFIVRKYLEENLYKSAETPNFLKHFDNSTSDMLSTYLYQKRYPVVNVEIDKKNRVYILTQEKLSAFQNDTQSSFGYRWSIPITYTYSFSKSPEKVMFPYYRKEITVPMMQSKWIKFNHHQSGIYRVNYPEELWTKLIQNYEFLTTPDRTHLIEESLFLYNYGKLSCGIAMKFLYNLQTEMRYMPWASLRRFVRSFALKLDKKDRPLFQDYIGYLTTSALERYAVVRKTDTVEDRLARYIVLDVNCYVRAFYCVHWLHTASKDELHPDLKRIYDMYKKILKLRKYRIAVQVVEILPALEFIHVYLFQSLLNGIVQEKKFSKLWKEVLHHKRAHLENLEDMSDSDIWNESSQILDDNNSRHYKEDRKGEDVDIIKEQAHVIGKQFEDHFSTFNRRIRPIVNFQGENEPTIHHSSRNHRATALKDIVEKFSILQNRKRRKRETQKEKCNCKRNVKGIKPNEKPNKPADECIYWLQGYMYYILSLKS